MALTEGRVAKPERQMLQNALCILLQLVLKLMLTLTLTVIVKP